jgi:hypothetical protein
VAKRQRLASTEQGEQLELLFASPEQRTFELIRPVVLFAVPPKERAQQTGTLERSPYWHVQRFAAQGLRGMFPIKPMPPTWCIPDNIREGIAALKAEHPSLYLREIATICYVRFGRRLSNKTVKPVLAETPLPTNQPRHYPVFH